MSAKEIRPILAALRAQGWKLGRTTQGHWEASPPDETLGLVYFTDSDEPRALKNAVRDLKKRGFEWPLAPKPRVARPKKQEEKPKEEPVAAVAPVIVMSEPENKPEVELRIVPLEAPLEHEMDRLFMELKEAKQYSALAEAEYAECRAALNQAQARMQQATQAREEAAATLRDKKTAFDKVFSS